MTKSRSLFAALVLLCASSSARAADTVLAPTALTQVEVGASEDSWGEKLNNNAGLINALFDSVASAAALKVAHGGTGAITAAAARTNLGLGNIATLSSPTGSVVGTTDTQTLTNKTLTGAALNGTLGITTPAAAAVTNLTVTGSASYNGNTDPINSNTAGWSLSASGILALTSTFQTAFLNRKGSDGSIINFYRDGVTPIGSISVTTTATSYNTSSDYRLKDHVTASNAPASLALINAVRLRDFTWKATGAPDRGVLAHELQVVKPTAVTGVKDGAEMQAVDYSKLVPDLIGAVQALSAANDNLAARVVVLEGRTR